MAVIRIAVLRQSWRKDRVAYLSCHPSGCDDVANRDPRVNFTPVAASMTRRGSGTPLIDVGNQSRIADSKLLRVVGFWSLAAAIVNITIGGSIFALPGTLAASMGAAAPLALILGAVLFVPIVV